jgi:hypothetical protein
VRLKAAMASYGIGSLAFAARLLVARGLRILPYFAGIFRCKLRKLLILGELFRTLDQHIGVRIPGGQPNLMRVFVILP